MARIIRIIMDRVEVMAELEDTRTAQAIWDALPIRAEVGTWGKEIYFPVPVSLDLEGGQETVSVGDMGYWPSGHAFCIFFGLTPASRRDEIRPASAVNVFGRVVSDIKLLEGVSEGTTVVVEKGE